MKHLYDIKGMTCNGCKSHVEETLRGIASVSGVMVDADESRAMLEMERHIPLEELQQAFEIDGGRFSIHLPGSEKSTNTSAKEKENKAGKGTGVFYYLMRCEGDKTYPKPSDCPVCEMDLVEEYSHAI